LSDLFRGRRVLVTGGNGFLGSYVVEQLLAAEATVRTACRSMHPEAPPGVEVMSGDLRDRSFCTRAMNGVELVLHLAAFGWGLGENVSLQPKLLTENLLINTNVLDSAYEAGVDRYLYTSSSAVYTAGEELLDDDAPLSGEPHPAEACFGWAKRTGEIQARAYSEQYGMKIAIVRPTNPYGPRDTFDLRRSHVLPALIIRAEARENPFVVWGTGSAIRSFVHARDVARGMLLALERYAVCDPVNLAAAETTSIAALARLVLEKTGFEDAEFVFDVSRPEGPLKKLPAVRKAREKLGFEAETPLDVGVAETVNWYREERERVLESGHVR